MIRDYKDGGPAELVVDTVQRQLECCGFLGVEDWAREAENLVQVRAARANNRSVSSVMWLPASCCKEAACSLGNAFAESCQDKIRENYLNPNNAIGLLGKISSKIRIYLIHYCPGISIIVVVSFMILTLLISLAMCCIARR